MEFLRKIFGQILEFAKGLSLSKQLAMSVTAVVIVFGMVGLIFWASEKTFQPLMTNMSPDESANVIRILRDKRIPFKVDQAGKMISIPPENLLELRMELASLGLPQSNIVGYEVFDKQSLGTTSFVQRVNQKRALEGELMRTIGSIKGVRRSRVHLATPQKSTFVEDQKKSTASVVLDLDPGVVLSDKQIYGIGSLVAKAVEGMDTADVVIVDANGKMLSKNTHDPLALATASQFDFTQKFEQEIEKRVEGMLARIVGEGRVVARVSADLDFSQVNETQTIFDADGSAVRSVQKDVKSMEGTRPGPYGQPGAAANVPPGGQPQPAGIGQKTDTRTNSELTNYEVPQTVRRTTKQSGTPKRLSVAVLVDGKTVKTAGKDGKIEAKVEPWGLDKLKEFENIVASAVGIDRKRGDILEIKNMEFTREDFDEAERILHDNERKAYLQNMIIYLVVGLIILLFFALVVRPFIKWFTENTTQSVDAFLPQTIEELEKIQKTETLPELEEVVPVLPDKVDPEKVEGDMIKEKIIGLVDAHPHKAAMILRDWIHEEGKKKAKADEKDALIQGQAGASKSKTG